MYKTIKILFIIVANSFIANCFIFNTDQPKNSSNEYDFIELVNKHNYTAEEYKIKSKDGYNLCLHRISASPTHPKAPGKKVIYFQHGLAMWTVNFVLRGPGKDLVFLLVDAGYDVWMGNVRGNPYSRSHESKSPEDKKFWNFSYHEIALNDVTAFIDYALNVTKQRKLTYIGYSMGFTESLVLFSTLPEYNRKVSLIVGLAPVSLWEDKEFLVRFVSKLLSTLEPFNNLMNLQEVFRRDSPGKCNLISLRDRILCYQMNALFNFRLDHSLIDESAYLAFMNSYPVSTSAKTVFHLSQNINSGELRAYDYGQRGNKIKYKTEQPPKYPLEKITAPVALFYGPKDIFLKEKDVKNLEKALSNVIISKRISHEEFDHVHLILANDAKNLVFDHVLEVIAKYSR